MAPRSTKASANQHKLFCAAPARYDAVGDAVASTLGAERSEAHGTGPAPQHYAGTSPSGDACPTALLVAGIDEAGRGCLAGPVVAAAVLLPSNFSLPLLNDSKVLSARQRAVLAPQIKAVALGWSLGLSWPREIEHHNILQATFHAMARAVHSLRVRPETLLVDGNHPIPSPVLARFCAPLVPSQQAIVGGDALVPAISAASILAKTYRDQLMDFFHRRYPVYSFDAHKGYGTRAHMQALQAHGPCPLHRMTFAGVRPPQEKPTSQTQGLLC